MRKIEKMSERYIKRQLDEKRKMERDKQTKTNKKNRAGEKYREQ